VEWPLSNCGNGEEEMARYRGILRYFGKGKKGAVKRYVAFVEKGSPKGSVRSWSEEDYYGVWEDGRRWCR